LLPAIKAARPYQPPTIPDREPSEEYRVYLPNGLSIVRPPYWEVKTYMAADGFEGSFDFSSPIGNKPGAAFSVYWSKEIPKREAKGVVASFQGKPAWLKTEHREPVFMDYPGRFDAHLFSPRGDSSVTISYSYYGDQSAVPEMLWKYFETLQWPPPADAKPSP